MSVGRLVAVFFLAWVQLYLNSAVVTAATCGVILVGSFLWLVVPVATPEPQPTVTAPVSESDAAISVYVDRYLRDVIDVDGLEAGIDRVLRATVEPDDLDPPRFSRGVRVDRPEWVRLAEEAHLDRLAADSKRL